MDFDFHASYSNYTTIELLKIVLQKELYQVAAVEAAEKILQSRQVTEEERNEAYIAITRPIQLKEQQEELNEQLKNEIANSARRFFFPDKKGPAYNIRIFCIILSIIWLFANISNFRSVFSFFADENYGWGILITITQLGYLLAFYWLYKLNKKGWVLLLIYYSFSAGMAVNDLISLKPNLFFSNHNIVSPIYTLIYIGLTVYYFNRKDVLNVLGVSRSLHIKTITAISILFVLCVLRGEIDWSYYLG